MQRIVDAVAGRQLGKVADDVGHELSGTRRQYRDEVDLLCRALIMRENDDHEPDEEQSR